jgi:hypothetical protein
MLFIRSAKVVAAALILAAAPALVSAKHATVRLAAVTSTPAPQTTVASAHKHASKLSHHVKKHVSLHSKSIKHHALSHRKVTASKLSHKHVTASKLAHHKTAHSSLSSKGSSLFAK